jgi:hypothetical protein
VKHIYLCSESLLAHVDYMWVSKAYRSITVHYKRTTPVFHLCVSAVQHPGVAKRGNGLHGSDGHQAMFQFLEGGACRVKCYDHVCQQHLQNRVLGRVVCALPACLVADALEVLTAMAD